MHRVRHCTHTRKIIDAKGKRTPRTVRVEFVETIAEAIHDVYVHRLHLLQHKEHCSQQQKAIGGLKLFELADRLY